MNRSLLVTIHLYLSSFFAAMVVVMATSGGLYLLGVKGSVTEEEIAAVGGGNALLEDPSKEAVLATLAAAGIEGYSFDYVKSRGETLYTRPTSRSHYILDIDGDAVTVTRAVPSLQKRLMELHLGHGPSLFRDFEKVFAAGMLFIILSGVWLGLKSPKLRRSTLISTGAGFAMFLALTLL